MMESRLEIINGVDNSTYTLEIPSSGISANEIYANVLPDIEWSKGSITHLIQCINDNKIEFYSKSVKKKKFWKYISNEMHQSGFHCSSDDCDKKWRNLKKTYSNIIKKHAKGDYSSKFCYFDQMNEILCDQFNLYNLKEEGLNHNIEVDSLTDEIYDEPYREVSIDGGFLWTNHATNKLLDEIDKHTFLLKDADRRRLPLFWEKISDGMMCAGYEISERLCERKWSNLMDGFMHHQSKAEQAGVLPAWPFHRPVLEITHTVNVPYRHKYCKESTSIATQQTLPSYTSETMADIDRGLEDLEAGRKEAQESTYKENRLTQISRKLNAFHTPNTNMNHWQLMAEVAEAVSLPSHHTKEPTTAILVVE